MFLYITHKNSLLDGIDKKLLTAAYSIEEILPKNYHDSIVNKESVSMNEYLKIVDRYNKFCVKLGLQYVWSLMIVNDQIVFTSGTSTSKDVSKGDHALFFDLHTNPSIYEKAFDTMEIQYSSFHDKWGDGRMVLVPKYDNTGRRYILASSMSVIDLNSLIRKTMTRSITISSIILLAGLIFSFILSTIFSKPIIRLTEVAEDIASGNLHHKIQVRGSSELINLSKSIEVMSISIREKIEEIEEKNVALNKDIVKRKEIEAALKLSEKKYRKLIERIQAAVVVHSNDGSILTSNTKAQEILKLADNEMKEKSPEDPYWHFIDDGGRRLPVDEYPVIQVLKHGKSVKEKTIGVFHSDRDKLLWVIVYADPVFDDNGVLDQIIVTFMDVTDRMQIAQKLKESEQRYRSVYDTAPLAFVVWDKECKIQEWNDQAEKIFGYSRKEVLDRNFFDLIIPDIEKTMVEQVVENLLHGKLDTNVINQNITKDGNLIWCEWNNAILQDSEGHITAAMSLGLDITERVKAEEELKDHRQHLEELVEKRTAELKSKNKELETFTYSVSHDLKAPLRGIDGYSRLLTEEYADRLDEEGLKFLSNVRHSAEQMNQLIEDLLAYSRMERRSLHKSAINLKAVIELLIHERQHDIESGQIQIDIKLPIESIHADSDTLRQVLGNYIDNAIKFAHQEKQPLVEVGGNENDDKWTIWVKDNGIGFEPKYQDRIFQIFQRLHRIEDYPGTGVGLAIVRKAVERMGGRVWAESTVGEGATFYVEIPKEA